VCARGKEGGWAAGRGRDRKNKCWWLEGEKREKGGEEACTREEEGKIVGKKRAEVQANCETALQ
jgi:hypothetical protein